MGCKVETRLTQGPWKFLHGSWLGRESRKDRTRERKVREEKRVLRWGPGGWRITKRIPERQDKGHSGP